MAAWLYFPPPNHLRGTLSLTISSSHGLEGDVRLVLVIITSWSVEFQWLSGRTLPTHHLSLTFSHFTSSCDTLEGDLALVFILLHVCGVE